jgi:predicted kinase
MDIVNDKTTFYGHAYASIQPTINFITYLRSKIEFNIERVMYLTITAISNHINFYNKDIKNKNLMVNNDEELYHVSMALTNADINGSVNRRNGRKKLPVFELTNDKKFNPLKRNIYVWCGLPGSGKDYMANLYFPTIPVFSFDKMRIEAYDDHVKNDIEENDKKYHAAFEFCNEKKINLLDMIKKKTKNIGDFAICNVNLTKKARTVIVNSFGDANYHCYYVTTDSKTAIARDSKRKMADKSVGVNVIEHMAKNQIIPTLSEGFSFVHVLFNGEF